MATNPNSKSVIDSAARLLEVSRNDVVDAAREVAESALNKGNGMMVVQDHLIIGLREALTNWKDASNVLLALSGEVKTEAADLHLELAQSLKNYRFLQTRGLGTDTEQLRLLEKKVVAVEASGDHQHLLTNAGDADCLVCEAKLILSNVKPADLGSTATCPKCKAEYARENASGLRVCRKCGALVDAKGNN